MYVYICTYFYTYKYLYIQKGGSSSMDVEITTGIPLVDTTFVDLACAPSIPTPTTKKEAAALKKKEKTAEKVALAAEKASKKKGTTKATAIASTSVNCVSTLTKCSGENKSSAIIYN
jgi:hypothetical protein